MGVYIYTSVLLCVYTHSACGSICQVDALVMLTWSKVCITKTITISITISIHKLSSTVNHTIQKLSFVDNWSDLWKTGQICGHICRSSDQLTWKTAQICRSFDQLTWK